MSSRNQRVPLTGAVIDTCVYVNSVKAVKTWVEAACALCA
jgi:hypothetical protein